MKTKTRQTKKSHSKKQSYTLMPPRARRIVAISVFLLVFISLGAFGIRTQRQENANAATSPAKVSAEKRVNAQTLDLTIKSPSIESSSKKVRLLLPAGWSKKANRTWPTLWLLHGGVGNYEDWTKNTDVAKLVAGHDVIVVMPDTSWCSAYSDWWNYGHYGKPAWETYITKELPQLLQTSYHANTTRAIAGPSMGGLGAMKLAANHPGAFKAAASYSGNLDPLHSYNRQATQPDKPGQACFADWKRVWGDYKVPSQKAIWQKNNPYDLAPKLKGTKYLYISSGDGKSNPLRSGVSPDPAEQEVNRQGKAMVTRLQNAGIPVNSYFYAGSHAWPYWQQQLHASFPGMLQAMNTK